MKFRKTEVLEPNAVGTFISAVVFRISQFNFIATVYAHNVCSKSIRCSDFAVRIINLQAIGSIP